MLGKWNHTLQVSWVCCMFGSAKSVGQTNQGPLLRDYGDTHKIHDLPWCRLVGAGGMGGQWATRASPQDSYRSDGGMAEAWPP